MTSLFDKWGLNPQERRLVAGVGIAVFVVLNLWLIIPKFGEFGRLQQKGRDVRNLQIEKYKVEIANKSIYEAKIRELLATGGKEIPDEDAATRILSEINDQANISGVDPSGITPLTRSSGKTNAFFEEAYVNVQYNCDEKNLIDFLQRIAHPDLMIRAKSMTVAPALPTRTKLQGRLTLVKSYQRKAPAKPSAPAPAKPSATPPAKPAPSTTAKPASTPPGPPAPGKPAKN